METSQKLDMKNCPILTYLSEGSHARVIAWLEKEKDCMIQEQDYFLKSGKSWKSSGLNILSLKMLQDCLMLIEDGTWQDVLLNWPKLGTISNGVFSILRNLEFHKPEKEFLLSDILKDDVDEKYFLRDEIVEKMIQENGLEKVTIATKRYKNGRDGICTDVITKAELKKQLNKDENFNKLLAYSKSTRQDFIDHRIRIDGIANTINSGDGGRSQSTANFVAVVNKGKMRIRKLTPLETERLMSWPDNWTKFGLNKDGLKYKIPDSCRYSQTGNGVVSEVAKAMVNYIWDVENGPDSF